MQLFNFNTCVENLGCLSIYKSEAVLYVYQSLQNMKIYKKKVHTVELRITEIVCVCHEFNIYRYYLLYISHSFELKTPFLYILYLNEKGTRVRV